MKKITIAIDGYSSTGKSTLAKQIAKKLSYVYVDSGAMYRAITLYALQNNLILDDKLQKNTLLKYLDNINLSFQFNAKLGYAEVYLNNKNVESKIRTLQVSSFVSKVAAITEVRQKLVKIQKKLGEHKGVVMDGRDIGTVVFPNAELKLFMTASADKRAERRYLELKARGDNITFKAVLKNINERDYIDTHRDESPLIKAKDAIEFDNTNVSLEEQYKKVLEFVNKALNRNV